MPIAGGCHLIAAKAESRPGAGKRLDVVVPVYSGEDETRRCLESVFRAVCSVDYDVVVIDDASPDPRLSEWLDELAGSGRIVLLRNASNLGFVASANRGMALHPDRDVVLLNSDTRVTGDWLGRLTRCLQAHPDAGTLTPFSNNATICSYPYEGWAGDEPGTLGLEALDALFAERLAGAVIEIPSGVGFCMYVRRQCLDAVGLFDELAFGRGYGEENDLCMRARKAGWRNLLCADVFVYHRGGVSFGESRTELMRAGAEALRRLHPEYDATVRRFIAADPIRPLREAIDQARAAVCEEEAAAVTAEKAVAPHTTEVQPVPAGGVEFNGMDALRVPDVRHWRGGVMNPVSRSTWLHVSHGWGGGIERWVRDMAAADQRGRHLWLRSQSGRNHAGVRLELLDLTAGSEVLLAWDLGSPVAYCAEAHEECDGVYRQVLELFQVDGVFLSSLIGHSLDILKHPSRAVVVIHDLFPYCAALFGWFERACTDCDGPRLQACLSSNPHNVFWQHDDTAGWLCLRDAFLHSLKRSGVSLAAPSHSAFERLASLMPGIRELPWAIIPHGLANPPPRHWHRRLRPDGGQAGLLRVLVPGRLLPHKGLDLLRGLLPGLQGRAEVRLLGCGDYGRVFAHMPHVSAVADYCHAQLPAHVAAFDPDCALLLSSLPETFSYTLSEMQALGIPVLATRMGAFAERIDDEADGVLVDADVLKLGERLLELADAPEQLAAMAKALRLRPARSAERMLEDYERLMSHASHRTTPAEAAGDLLARAVQDARIRLRWSNACSGARAEQAEQALNDLRRQHDELLTQCRDLRWQLERTERWCEALTASTSWRITAPVRALVRRFTSGRHERKDCGQASLAPVRSVWLQTQDSTGRNRFAALKARLPVAGGSTACVRTLGAGEEATIPPQAGGSVAVCLERVAALEPLRCLDFGPAVRFVVPNAYMAEALRSRLPEADVVQVDFPVSFDTDGRHKGVGAGTEGVAYRDVCRARIGVSDRARIVLGVGARDHETGLPRFADLAMSVGAQENGVVFVWLGMGEEPTTDGLEDRIALPQALRRLFLVSDSDIGPWLKGADLYLGCRSALSYDGPAVEALVAGLPVAALDSASLADGLDDCVHAVDGSAAAVVQALHARPPNMQAHERLLQRFASDAAWEAFMRAGGAA